MSQFTLSQESLGNPSLAESDLPRYIEMYRRGKLPVDRLMGRRFGLEDINLGLDRLATGEAMRDVILF